ncbi:hypothetical protein D8674_016570 [Pyrus ussuriensis x Pyrus communis]|uniref:Geraniol 8-hydroxylase-like n=1 Tax=Pyrus ussuriensis x Pyrus communis TaxID=2448454 RepID=A0A5N5HHF8_9ROSA|nr:hypothetical protein D8674_016570 [Pyrus ussuriensis x Pyrus communis]
MDFLSCMILFLVIIWISVHAIYYSFAGRSSSPTRLPPGPNPLPFIGNPLELGSIPHISLTNLSQRHGPNLSLRLGHVTTVVVSSSIFFCNRTIPDAIQACDHAKYGMPWMQVSAAWRNLRKICNSQLDWEAKLADYFPVLKKIDPMGIRRRLANHFQKMIGLFDRMITQRLESRKSRDYVTTKDMLDTLINFSEEKSEDMNVVETEHLFLIPSDCTQLFHFYFPEKPK